MAMQVTLWCDLCPTLLEMEAFEVEMRTRQILPRQDHSFNTQRLHLCGECYDKIQGHVRPLKQRVRVTAQFEAETQPKRKAQS